MDPTPPTWRVFDAPAAASEPAGAGSAAPGSLPPADPWRRWLQPRAALALAGAAVLAVAALVVAVGSLGAGPTIDVAGGTTGGPLDSGAAGRAEIVVQVAGAVARPGVYHVPTGSRIGDVIAAAGGFGPRVAADRVDAELNLAAIVHDGDRILVPSRDAPGPGSSGSPSHGSPSGQPVAALIDINHATREQLDTLPGIGLITADKIIAARAEKPFGSVDELRERGLVGQKTFDKLRSLITVS